MSSEGDGRPYRLKITRILLNQELSVGIFIASCRRLIYFSTPLLVIHLQKRPSIFLCRTHSTGGIPSKAKDADDCVLSGKCCICFNDFLWYCFSWLISDCFSSWTSSPYRSLGITYVDHNFPLTLSFNPLILWKPVPISEYAVLLPRLILSWIFGFWLISLNMPRCFVCFSCWTWSLPMVYTTSFGFCGPYGYVSTQLSVGWMLYLFLPA